MPDKVPLGSGFPGGRSEVKERGGKILVADSELESSQIQDLAEIIPKLLEVKAKHKVPFRFSVRVEMGDGKFAPTAKFMKDANNLLKRIKEGLELK